MREMLMWAPTLSAKSRIVQVLLALGAVAADASGQKTAATASVEVHAASASTASEEDGSSRLARLIRRAPRRSDISHADVAGAIEVDEKGTVDAMNFLSTSGHERVDMLSLGALMQKFNLGFGCDSVSVSVGAQGQDASEELGSRKLRDANTLARLCGTTRIRKIGARRPDGMLEDGTSEGDAGTALGSWLHEDVRHHGGVITIKEWSGYLGNRLLSLGAAMVFAKYTGASTIHIGSSCEHKEHTQCFGYPHIFTIDAEAAASGTQELRLHGIEADPGLQKSCKRVDPAVALGEEGADWWHVHCYVAPAPVFHEMMVKHVRPYFVKNLTKCVDAPVTAEERSTLLVHYRSGDKASMKPRDGPPCALAEKVFADGGFKKYRIVSGNPQSESAVHPCVHYFKKKPEATVQQGSLLEDVCSILRAPNLLSSFSTFPETLALLSTRLQNYYHQGSVEPLHTRGEYTVNYCTDESDAIWPGTKWFQYKVDDVKPQQMLVKPAKLFREDRKRHLCDKDWWTPPA